MARITAPWREKRMARAWTAKEVLEAGFDGEADGGVGGNAGSGVPAVGKMTPRKAGAMVRLDLLCLAARRQFCGGGRRCVDEGGDGRQRWGSKPALEAAGRKPRVWRRSPVEMKLCGAERVEETPWRGLNLMVEDCWKS